MVEWAPNIELCFLDEESLVDDTYAQLVSDMGAGNGVDGGPVDTGLHAVSEREPITVALLLQPLEALKNYEIDKLVYAIP